MQMAVFIVATVLAVCLPAEGEKVDVCVQWIPPSAVSSIFVRSLQHELDGIFRHAAVSVIASNCANAASGIVIPCEVRGHCDRYTVFHTPHREPDQLRLGWTHTSYSRTPGRIGIDCGAIASFAKQVDLIFSPMDRPGLFDKVTARVLAHEILHALLGSKHQASSHLCHSGFKGSELLVEPRLTADELN